MTTRHMRRAGLALSFALIALLCFGGVAATANPIVLLPYKREFAKHQRQSKAAIRRARRAKHARRHHKHARRHAKHAARRSGTSSQTAGSQTAGSQTAGSQTAGSTTTTPEGFVPPPTPCPQNGLMPNPTVMGIGVIPNCGIPEAPVAAGEPYPGQMSYYGGHVQTHPKLYLVLWGWGRLGAFNGAPGTTPKARPCTKELVTEGTIHFDLACDPDGAGKYMADFLYGIGGTQWANVQDQYYQATHDGKAFIDESGQLLAGVWVDNSASATVNPDLSKTSSTNLAGPTNTYTEMALEATQAAKHFGVNGAAALDNANFIIAQPQSFSDPQAATTSSTVGYCAFHDYTLKSATGNPYYNYNGIGLTNPTTGANEPVSYTNMPYTLNAGVGCGQGSVNQPSDGSLPSKPGDPGYLDAFSIGLGHEVQETVTDPGAEDVVGNITNGGTSYYGGWYDQLDANENGDKCAYVGLDPLFGAPGAPSLLPIPGAMGNITTPRNGDTFAVQANWSDASAHGAGWCAGIASTDLPGGLAGEPPYS